MANGSNFAQTSAGQFDNTVWTVVFGASRNDPAAGVALEELCRIYWPPIYTYLRRKGRSPEDAKDLTQGFFRHLLDPERKRLGTVDPAKGKFRSWLLACLNNYVLNEHAKSKVQGQMISIPGPEEDLEFWEISSPDKDPEKVFVENWAKRLILSVLDQLKEQCQSDGKAHEFNVLLPFLNGTARHGGFADAAKSLSVSEGAARVAATRLRQEFNRLLRAHIAQTVDDPTEVDDEIQFLKAALRG